MRERESERYINIKRGFRLAARTNWLACGLYGYRQNELAQLSPRERTTLYKKGCLRSVDALEYFYSDVSFHEILRDATIIIYTLFRCVSDLYISTFIPVKTRF